MEVQGDLGVFGSEQGPRSGLSTAGFLIALGAAAAFGARVVFEVVQSSRDLRVLGRVSIYAGVAGFFVALLGLYEVGTKGKRGRLLANLGISIGPIVAITAFVHGAIRDGSFRPRDFGHSFLDGTVFSAIWRPLLRGARNTIFQAFAGEVLSIVLGLIIVVFVLSKRRWLHLPGIAYVDAVRGTPLIVLGILIYGGLPKVGITLGAFQAIILALAINASAYVAEIFRAGIQSLPRGQTDAAWSLGMPYGTAMLFVVIPQAVRAVVPPLMSEFIALIKDTAILSAVVGTTVATADIFSTARTAAQSTFSATPYVGAALTYLLLTVPLTRIVGRLERRVRAGLA